MVVVPSAPIILSFSLVFKGEIVEHATSVALSFFDDALKQIVGIGADSRLGIGIDLQCEQGAGVHHDRGECLNACLAK